MNKKPKTASNSTFNTLTEKFNFVQYIICSMLNDFGCKVRIYVYYSHKYIVFCLKMIVMIIMIIVVIWFVIIGFVGLAPQWLPLQWCLASWIWTVAVRSSGDFAPSKPRHYGRPLVSVSVCLHAKQNDF